MPEDFKKPIATECELVQGSALQSPGKRRSLFGDIGDLHTVWNSLGHTYTG